MDAPWVALPRIVVAGLAGSTGKTLIALGLVRALARRGLTVAPFKKGPDYIDVAWLGAAAHHRAQTLDTYLMSDAALTSALAGAAGSDLVVIEGNRGLFDGQDAQGSHSTAALARRLQTPVVLVVDVTKATRTIAALVLGCLALEPGLTIAGVILNRVGTPRQEQVIRDALAGCTALPVLGAVPRLAWQALPSRHHGLVMPAQRSDCDPVLDRIADVVADGVDLDAVVSIARTAPAVERPPTATPDPRPGLGLRIGYLKDEAFCFYYAENLAALEALGATLVPLSPLHDRTVPPLDALVAGGGYPEAYAGALAANRGFRSQLATCIAHGLPVWAECGGLMYLASTLMVSGRAHAMVGALPIVVEQTGRPQGHGYVHAVVDMPNPFLPTGTVLRGHEFHYSRVRTFQRPLATALSLVRGVGVGAGRDGIVRGRVFASYTHVLASGAPAWAHALIRAAREPNPENPITTGDQRGINHRARPAHRDRRGWLHPGAREVE